MQYTFITDDQALNEFCLQASQVEAIAVDTEFVRTRTLYPKLGLIQIYDGQQLVLVDPLCIKDFSALKALLTNPDVVKVLHSCSEDLETFWHAFKVMPAPIFDSQFAASIVGMGTSLGYAKLVEQMLGVIVDKGESRTDWIARPLREEQCAYAANDVLYLFQLYPELKSKVEAQNKLAWVYSEIELLSIKKQTPMPLENVYLGMKNNWKLSGRAVLILRKLAAWRTATARTRDMALNFVVREEHLIEIARQQPLTKNALRDIQGMNPHEIRIHGDALVEIVTDCQQTDPKLYPPRVERLNDFEENKNTVSAVRKICADIAAKNDIPVELVGSKKQINQLLKWCWFNTDETRALKMQPDLISGWRKPLFESALLKVPSLKLAQALAKEAS
ncbi:ribonuclease D [Paraglaciecola aquimarina]|uniref:Ribonuclease D n=1 Tax=Paraglaciecola algarum TaxID=3050085 RepID=A0ABS9D9Y5_9ALTE|nr:ribonuclease D [Paraglaciecola sp. G1-23]MCF2949773.1 ribonuclease D [Paraglaciecola sp. G1-23]